MTLQSAVCQVRFLLTGDRKLWRLLPYLVWLKWKKIDLRWQSVEELALPADSAHAHSNSGGPYLTKVIDSLEISPADSVLDIGCGKGGAMLSFARAPFSRIDGVELSPAVAEIARNNLKRARVSNVTVYCGDAAEFDRLDSYNYFYMFNPFPEAVTARVLDNIRQSARRRARKITLIYKNPIFEAVVLASGFRKIRTFDHDYPPFAMYVLDAAHF